MKLFARLFMCWIVALSIGGAYAGAGAFLGDSQGFQVADAR